MLKATAPRQVHKLSMTGGKPAILYGASCYGTNEAELLARRRALSKTMRPAASGRSLDALHLLHGDPAFDVAVAPIMACAAQELATSRWEIIQLLMMAATLS